MCLSYFFLQCACLTCEIKQKEVFYIATQHGLKMIVEYKLRRKFPLKFFLGKILQKEMEK